MLFSLFSLVLVSVLISVCFLSLYVSWYGNQYDDYFVNARRPMDFVLFQPPRDSGYKPGMVTRWLDKPLEWDTPTQFPIFEHGGDNHRYVIFVSHSGHDDLGTMQHKIKRLAEETGASVMTWDYSGFGWNPLSPDERTSDRINESLRHIVLWYKRQFPATVQLIGLGDELGCGPTLANADLFDRLILINPFSTVRDLVEDWTRNWKDSEKWLDKRWDNHELIRTVSKQVVNIFVSDSNAIPTQHGISLFGSCPSKFKTIDHVSGTEWPIHKIRLLFGKVSL